MMTGRTRMKYRFPTLPADNTCNDTSVFMGNFHGEATLSKLVLSSDHENWGLQGYTLFFFFLLKNIDCGVLVRTASSRRF